MKNTRLSLLTLLLAGIAVTGAQAQTPIVLVDGSSTVFPVSEAMAEEFQNAQGGAIQVTVGNSGTGGGFKKFCRGEVDVTGASRPITNDEKALCAESGVEFIEMPIAIDALANVINPGNEFASCMTVEQLKKLWEPAAQGTINNWNQLDPTWPDQKITLFGAGTDSGTYDYYTFAIVGEEHSSRGDFTATEDDNITVQGVSGDVNAIGFMGLAYVTENADKLKTVAIKQANGECVSPSVQTAADATYQPLTRPLFWYISKGASDAKPEVAKFIEFAFQAETQDALVAEVGYVPLPAEASALALEKFEARHTGSAFDGGSKVGVTITDLVTAAGAGN
ncbi:MAG: PstS family phosphate ABC transporter substrate-binding protein [Devosia sp.]|uniref:PstS family phosphate ABC transporter substrate-binding protein n=1 Tax=Devosia sp. TaxID=1871048 RepID=UPI001AC64F83|nr:PstS family phosphate ABC transporter substrate-binding protein [Devosia sp.]MBN9317875.1 PstS family phosphate ABC transporter substrate-binding protein [Devosia sp.]